MLYLLCLYLDLVVFLFKFGFAAMVNCFGGFENFLFVWNFVCRHSCWYAAFETWVKTLTVESFVLFCFFQFASLISFVRVNLMFGINYLLLHYIFSVTPSSWSSSTTDHRLSVYFFWVRHYSVKRYSFFVGHYYWINWSCSQMRLSCRLPWC